MEEVNSGIYVILNVVNYKMYIGSTNDFDRRKYEHLKKLRGNYHYNKYLQRSFNKYKEESFKFIVYQRFNGSQEELLELEQSYLDNLYDKSMFYNVSNMADSLPIVYGEEHHAFGEKHYNSESIVIDNIEYGSLMDASRELNIKGGTIWYRLNSSNFTNYNYIDKNKKPIKKKIHHAKGKNHPLSKKILIDNKIYYGIRPTAELFNITRKTMKNRLENPNFPNYQYA